MSSSSPITSKLASLVRRKPSPTPKYFQVEEALRDQIATWATDKPFPTEQELCQSHGVSRATVRKALENLVHEGLLYRVQGVGTFVAPPKLRERFVQRTAGFYEDMTSRGMTVHTRVLEQTVVRATKQVASELQIPPGEKVVRLVRLRLIDNEPILISTSFVPQRLCPELDTDDLTNHSLYALMREKYGVQLVHGTRLVEVGQCTEEEAKLLRVKVNAPLLVVTGTVYDVNDRPVEHGAARHRSDRSQVEIEIVTQ